MANAEYFRAWRAAHPDYRRREAARRDRRRALLGRGSRSAEYRNRARRDAERRASEEIPPLHIGHPLFDAARALVGPARSGMTVLLDPLHEELLSVAVLALVAGEDAAAAIKQFRTGEQVWRHITTEIVGEFAA